MADFDQNSADCTVFTFKDGILSAVAHDLRLQVGRFTLKVSKSGVEGRFDAGSLTVETPMRDGRDTPSALGQRDKDKIAKTIVDEVLLARRHPEIRFSAGAVTVEGEHAALRGELTLLGQTRAMAIEAKKQGGRWVAEVWVNQPDFGMKPYSAMLGTLKIKPGVRVLVTLPASAVDGELGAS